MPAEFVIMAIYKATVLKIDEGRCFVQSEFKDICG